MLEKLPTKTQRKMTIRDTKTFRPDEKGLIEAADALRNGGLVAFPTETVYGLGADAQNDTAVANIYAAKGRPQFNPLIAHFADISQAKLHVKWSDMANHLAEALWPGPLTLVLERRNKSNLSQFLCAGLPSVAIRIPAHPIAEFGRPMFNSWNCLYSWLEPFNSSPLVHAGGDLQNRQ